MSIAPPESRTPASPESLDLGSIGRSKAPGSDLEATAEVSDLITTLPWWATRGIVYIIAGFVFCALVWAAFTPIDLVTEARGAIIPEGNVRPLQALEAGKVRFLLAQEGQTVQQGQAIVQLDDADLRLREKQLASQLDVTESGLLAARASASGGNVLQTESEVFRLRSELDAVRHSIRRTTLTAPVAGVLTAISIRGPGAVVEIGQAVAVIAPAGARLVAEALVPNEHGGEVRPGLRAKLLLDAYPFQRFGPVGARVLHVSPDAVSTPQGSFYKAVLELDPSEAMPKGIRLKPGLSLTAQIVTERRNALRMFIDPFSEVTQSTEEVR